MGWFRWLKRKKGIKLEFKCLECGHEFKQKVVKLFCDLNTFDQKQKGKAVKYSEYVIPERVICHKCQAVDRFELGPLTYRKLTVELLKIAAGMDRSDSRIQFIQLGLSDGRLMHPLEAIDWYAQQVTAQPKRVDRRVKYANTLRSMGHISEAEAQYHAALEIDPGEVEALINLAVIYGAHRDPKAAYDLLRRLVESASKSKHPNRKMFADCAQEVLEGKTKLSELKLMNPVVEISSVPRRSRSRKKGKPRSK